MSEVAMAEFADLVSVGSSGLRVGDDAYTSAEVFDAEMQRVFESGWVYLGHESEVPTAGDYKTGVIGIQPVVVTRHEDGEVYALLNRCRHRGMVVCRAAAGHSHYLRCAYHNWTYSGDGTLIGVAQADGYPDDFDKSLLALQRVAQIGIYRGFIFGNLASGGPSLEDHLAPVRSALDAWLSRSPSGEVTLSSTIRKTSCPENWKRYAQSAQSTTVGQVFVFPNLCLSQREVTVITPVEAGTTELSSYACALDAVPGPGPEAEPGEGASKPRNGGDADEAPLQSFYREWKRRMMS